MIPIKSPIEFPGTAESAASAVSARRAVSRLLVQSGQAPEAPNRRAAMEALQLGCHEETWSDLMALMDYHQWEFQDPKMEVLYHIRPYFGGIFPYIGLT